MTFITSNYNFLIKNIRIKGIIAVYYYYYYYYAILILVIILHIYPNNEIINCVVCYTSKQFFSSNRFN